MVARRSLLAASMVGGALAMVGWPVRADESASGPVKFIVSFPAGGSTDVVIRAIAAQMQSALGRPVVVENKAGASGMLAAGYVAKADPDGLTLLAAASSLASNPAMFKSMPFDTLNDLRPLSLIFRTPLVLVVNPDLPARSIRELTELLKEKPGQLHYGHGGPGSAIHLAAELFQVMTDTKMEGVAYRGAPIALNDLIGGRIQLMFADVGSVMGQIEARHVRALAVGSTERVPVLPDVPTMAESGVSGFDAEGWTMVCAPAATPQDIVDKLVRQIGAAAEVSEVRDLMVKLGMLPTKSPGPPELKAWLAAEIDRWGRLIERSGVAKSI